MKNRWLLALAISGFFLPVFGQKFTVSGFVSDSETGEKLMSASVFDQKSKQGTVTNTYGFFSLTLPKDSVDLIVTYIGFDPQALKIRLSKNENWNVALLPSTLSKEVIITADKYEKIEERTQMSRIDIPIEQIKRVPALLGEVDVLKALQLLPGVQSGGEGQSGIYVRGGSPDQNLILLDGVPVYNASHLFGFFSVFNADAIKDVNLTKGGFPARYGGRLSSVIEINMKEGNENELHGEGSIGLISSKLTLEGPIKKGKSSFLVSGRRTYLDLVFRPLIKAAFRSDGSEGVAGYFFHDFNAKANWKFSDRDRVYLSFYGGRDKFYADFKDNYSGGSEKLESGLGWGNITSALRHNHVWGPKLFSNTTLTFSQYALDTKIGTESIEKNANQPADTTLFRLKYGSGIDDIAGRIDFDWNPNPSNYVRFGAHLIGHRFDPGLFDLKIQANSFRQDTSFGQKKIAAPELSAWIEDDFKVGDRLKINAGLHVSAFFHEKKTYPSLQPRFSARYLLDKGVALKAGFSTMQQNIHLLTNENIGLPTDLWLPATNKIRPEKSWQAAIGAAKTIGDGYEFSIEAYYKKMDGVIAFKEGASIFQSTDWQERIVQGEGESYGAEFFIQKKKGRFSGWLGYTLSWTNRQFDDLNFGKKYPYKYDRRHDFEVVGSYKISDRIRLSATWVYGTGNAVTLAESRFYSFSDFQNPDNYSFQALSNFKERNNYRMRAYHRLDWGIDFTKKKKRHERTWSFGAYNSYSRKNPFFIYTTTETTLVGNEYKSETVLKQASLFPVIPYFSYAFKF